MTYLRYPPSCFDNKTSLEEISPRSSNNAEGPSASAFNCDPHSGKVSSFPALQPHLPPALCESPQSSQRDF